MDIKPLRGMVGRYGRLTRNVIATGLPDDYAQSLIKRGLAVPVQAATREAAAEPPARPPQTRRNGGPAGAGEKPSSLLPAARAPRTSRSKQPGSDAG